MLVLRTRVRFKATNMTEVIEEIVEKDVTTICRICLKNDGAVSIFSESEAENDYTLQERIMSFAYVEIFEGDGLPSQICKKCLVQINRAFKFKAQCEYADAWLRQFLSVVNNEEDVKKMQLALVEPSNEELNETECHADQADLSDSEAQDMKLIVPLENRPTAAEGDANIQEIETETSGDIFIADNIPLVIWNSAEIIEDQNRQLPLQIIVPNVKETNNLPHIPHKKSKNSKNSEEEMHKCVFCDKVFALQGSLINHLREHEPTGDFRCIECGRAFPHEVLLDFHVKTHTADRPYCCTHCGKCFMQLSTLTSHERNHRRSRAFLCSHCGKLFANRKEHICPMLHERREKVYQCNECGKKFMRRSTLATHRKRHGLVERFRCKTCFKPFYSGQELLRHTNVHLGIRPFACNVEECDHTFYTQGELNRHLRYHRGEKKFKCDLCNKSFYESGHLVNHRRKHTGERPFVCQVCSKSFMDASKLKRHVGIHAGSPSRRTSKTNRKDGSFEDHLAADNKYDQTLERTWAMLGDGVVEEEAVEIQTEAVLESEQGS